MTRTSATPEMRQKARALRNNMTRAEEKLWQELRVLHKKGLKFRRQSPIGPYIVDFVCLSRRVVVEVDGDAHESDRGKTHDAVRDAYLKSNGFAVLRFDEPQARENAWRVAKEVEDVAAKRPVAEKHGRSPMATDPTRPAAGAAVHPPREGEGCAAAGALPHNVPGKEQS